MRINIERLCFYMKIKHIIVTALALVISIATTINVSAYSNYAYSMGGEFFSGNDVIQAADYWALCGYNSFYNINPTYSYVSTSNILNSDILYFSAHGNQHLIKLKNNIYVTDGHNNASADKVGIMDYSLTNTKLVVYDACGTAAGTSNLCTQTRSSGADAVIGWRVSILSNDARKWQTRFQDYCALGYKVHLAMDYADSFNDYSDNTTIKNHLIYGNWTQVIKKTSLSSINNLSEETLQNDSKMLSRIHDIPEIYSKYEYIQTDSIEKSIKSIYKNFDKKNYKMTVISTSENNNNFVVDYNLMNGEFITNKGFTIIFRDNVASTIYNNFIDEKVEKKCSANLNAIDYQRYVNIALDKATSEAKALNEKNIVTSQTWKPYYDIDNDRYYILVSTIYDCENSGCLGAFSTYQCIDI